MKTYTLFHSFKLTLVLMTLSLILGVGNAWADSSYTLGWGSATGASGTYTNFTDVSGSVTGICSFSTAKNGANTVPAYNGTNSELRLYNGIQNGSTTNGGSITITPASGVTITGFTITAASYPTTKYKVGTGDLTTLSLSGTTTYTGSATGLSATNSSPLFIQDCNSSNQQLKIKTIVITYTASSATLTVSGGATSLAIGDSKVNGSGKTNSTLSFSGSNLSANATLAISGTNASMFSVSPTSVTPSTGTISNQTITVTYSPTAAGDHTATLTISSTGATSKEITLTGTGKYEVIWQNNGGDYTTTLVASGSKPTFPDAPTSCDTGEGASTTFYGWSTGTWSGKINSLAGKTIYTSAASMPTVSANGTTYHAVFCKGGALTYATSIAANDVVYLATSTASGASGVTGANANGKDADVSTTQADWMPFTVQTNSTGWKLQNGTNYIQATAKNFAFTESTPNILTFVQDGSTGKYRMIFTVASGSNAGTYALSDNAGSYWRFYKTSNTYTWYYVVKASAGTNYMTNCCTALGSINGSVKVISGTSATLQWDVLSGVDGTTPYSVSVSPSEGTSVGGISTVDGRKNCTISGLTAGTEYTFTINAFGDGSHCDKSQDIVATTPKITLGSASGTSTYIEGSGPGSKQTFTVTAVGLTGDLTVTAPTNFEVCDTENGTYASSKTLTATSGAVSTTVYFRLVTGKTAASSPYAGSVTVSGGSATSQTVAVNGTVSQACHTPTISGQPAASASYNMNVTATALSVTAAKGDVSDPTLTYQWYSNTANSKTTPEPSPIDGATSSSYTPPTTATGTKYYFCEVSSGACSLTSSISAITVNTPSLTVSETARAFGDREVNAGPYTMTFTVSGSNLAKDAGISLALSGTNAGLFSIDRTSLSATSNAVATTTITVTYSPNAVGSHSAQIDITSTGATTKTVALSGTSKEEYTIILNPGNGSLSAGGAWIADGDNLKQSVLDGTNVTLPTPTPGCSGWVFQGWKDGSAANNQASFSADRADGATFSLTADKTYYAVYRQSAPSGTSYDKITSTGDLTTGNYVIKTGSYAMKNTGPNWYSSNSYWYMSELDNSGSGASITNSDATITWTIIKFGDSYAIKNGTKYLGIDADGNITFDATPHLFSATYDGTNSRWIFTSATYTSYQIIYNYYFRAGTSQSTAILLYKQRSNPSGNYYTSPTCTSYAVSGAASPVAGGSVSLSATTAKNADVVYAYASPNSGYKFMGWEISGTGAALSDEEAQLTEITMGTADVTATANFGVLRSITLTGSGTVANGTISADKSSACAGETVTLTATPDTHYSLGSWTVTKTGDPSTTVTVEGNQFTMPDYNVTVDATMSEDPYRMVVFQNDGVAAFDDSGDASAVDATNKWKQKVYVGEAPVWPTKLDDSEACDATSNKFYGWATDTWSDVLADADALAAWDGGTVYTSGPLADVTAGTGDVVYHAVWAVKDGSDGTLTLAGSAGSGVWGGSYNNDDSNIDDSNDNTITIGKNNIIYQNPSSNPVIQIRNESGAGFWNKTAMPGNIISIKVKAYTANSFKMYVGTTSKPTSTNEKTHSTTTETTYDFGASEGLKYFNFVSNSAAAQISRVVVTYQGESSRFLTTCCDKNVTLATNSPANGTITFSPEGTIGTCGADAETRQTTMTVTPNAGYYLSAWSTTGVTPASLSTDIAYGSVSNSGAQATTVTFTQNTTTGTYTANATFSPIPVSSLTLHAIKKDNTSATIFEETSNNVALSLYPTEGKTASPADPLGHTVKIEFGAVLPANALNTGYTWSATVNGEDVGWSSNNLESNAVLEFNKNTGKVVAKAAGTAEIIITADDGSGVTAKVTITVANVALSSLNVAKSATTLYLGEAEDIAVTYDPVNTTTKGYTTGSYTYVTIGRYNDKITLTGKAVTPGEPERVTLTSSDAGAKTATIDVTVKPLPKVTFVDNLQGKTDFTNWGTDGVVSSTVTSGVVTHTKPTPTHSDVSDPGASYNACERSHLHLVGWIESTWADAHPSATHEQIVGANVSNGAGTFLEAGADLNVETYNGNIYYAVWSQVE